MRLTKFFLVLGTLATFMLAHAEDSAEDKYLLARIGECDHSPDRKACINYWSEVTKQSALKELPPWTVHSQMQAAPPRSGNAMNTSSESSTSMTFSEQMSSQAPAPRDTFLEDKIAECYRTSNRNECMAYWSEIVRVAYSKNLTPQEVYNGVRNSTPERAASSSGNH